MSNNKINININEPKYDQNYYIGRFRHFLETTNPLNLFASKKTLETAKTLVTKYKNNEPLPPNTTEEELWRAKRIYDSAFHPDTGEKMLLIGRMSAQVPMNTLISAGMLTFYQNSLSVLFWQIINQSFNTIVNYTNRSGSEEVTNKDMLISYFSAVTSAVTVALSLNKVVAKFPPIISRCVPLAAVIFCNCLNTPLSRRSAINLTVLINHSAYMASVCQQEIELCLDEPQYDQNTYGGRVMNYLANNNPFLLFKSNESLEDAATLVRKVRCGEPIPGDVCQKDIWEAKSIYDAFYRTDTGERTPFFGTIPTLIPIRTIIYSGLNAFPYSFSGIVFWHLLNQSHNSLIAKIDKQNELDPTFSQVATAYGLGTIVSIGTALGLNHFAMIKDVPCLVRRFIPFAAMMAGATIFIPITRAQGLKNGLPLYSEDGRKLAHSTFAAQTSTNHAIIRYFLMSAPPMLVTPFVMNMLERRGHFCRYPWSLYPVAFISCGLCLMFISPLTASLMKNKGQLSFRTLDPETKDVIEKRYKHRPKYLYYSKAFEN